MAGGRDQAGKGGKVRWRPSMPVLLGGVAAAVLFVSPAIGSALAEQLRDAPVSLAARGGIGSFTPASFDPQLAAQVSLRAPGHNRLFRFTPAGIANRPDRAITVAVRVSDLGSRVIAVRTALPAAATAPGTAPVRIAPMVFNLGAARGYQHFAPGAAAPALPHDIQRLDVPDLRSFTSAATPGAPARLAPRIELDERSRAGRAPRTLEGQSEYQLDLGGSYRLTRNIDVTAGIRYSPDRDRLRPLTDGKQDSQAVYVGTQFRF